MELNYKEAQRLLSKDLNKIRKTTSIAAFCRDNKFNYQTIINLKNNAKTNQPEMLRKVLSALGHNVIMKKSITYTIKS